MKKVFYVNVLLIALIVWAFALLAWNPHLSSNRTTQNKQWIDIAIVLDLSYSMLAEDIKPTRLEAAKKVISDFTSKLESDRVGLVLFSGKPFTSVPLTFDYDFITNFIQNITIDNINQDYSHLQGTAIGDGLLYGAQLFWEENEREKVIVLLTDGEANRGIDPLQAVKYVKDLGIKVYTVGIAWDEDTYVKVQNIYGTQYLAIGGIDEDNLTAIANITGWKYYRARDNTTFEKLFESLNLLDKKEIEIEKVVVLQPYYTPFLYALLVLIWVFWVWNIYFYIKN